MTRLIFCILILLAPFSARGFDILRGLVINYRTFAYISSAAVGFDYVYFGTTDGVIKYSLIDKKWGDPMTGISGWERAAVQTIKVSVNDQYIWIKTENGFFEYSWTFERWSPIDGIPDEPTNGRHLQPDPFYFAPPGYNYFSSGVLTDMEGRRFPLIDILDDGWGNYWIGTWGLGAARCDNTNRRLELLNFGLLQNDVSTIYVDSGLLWMGGQAEKSYRTGLTIFDWRKNMFDYIESQVGLIDLPDNINDISGNGKDIFAGTDRGVWVIDKKERKTWDYLQGRSGLPDDRVISLLASGERLFVGTESGLAIMNIYSDSIESNNKVILTSLAIYALEIVDSTLWIGTSQGAYRLDLMNGQLGRLNIPELRSVREVFDIERAGDSIWLAASDNLVAIDLNTAVITAFPEVNNFGGAGVIAVQDTIVAAAVRSGLLIFFNGEEPHHYLYTVNDGLLSSGIKDIAFDGDYLWLGTDMGLTRFWYKNPNLYH
jgi:ligand-binding sensor domain-containing protein